VTDALREQNFKV